MSQMRCGINAFGGMVPMDPAVRDAVHRRLPFALSAPDAPATFALAALARSIAGLPPPGRHGRDGFWRRLLGRLAGGLRDQDGPGRSENRREGEGR